MQLEILDYLLIALAAVAAGAVNALAGGGTLITFPALTAIGIPPVSANVTNTVALGPGYLGAALAQKTQIMDQRRRLWLVVPAALGGLTGGLILLNTGERYFRELVPYLILLASLLLAIQEPLRRWLVARAENAGRGPQNEYWAAIPIFMTAVYGGYFGAGLSVITLAVLGLMLDENLTCLNALKHVVTLATNLAAAALFIFSGQVVWSAAAVMAVGTLTGGVLGGRLAGHVSPVTLRWVIVTIGIIIAVIYFIRG